MRWFVLFLVVCDDVVTKLKALKRSCLQKGICGRIMVELGLDVRWIWLDFEDFFRLVVLIFFFFFLLYFLFQVDYCLALSFYFRLLLIMNCDADSEGNYELALLVQCLC
ncbi:hypothetical protein Hanom_Chr03g00192381 [Helianthus anomalus]